MIGKVAYELELPTELAAVHPVIHISLLKKCVGDPASIVPLERVAAKDSLTYEEVSIEIIHHRVRRLRNKEVASVKVLCRNQSVEGATWEAEATMKAKYPHLFPSYSVSPSEVVDQPMSGGKARLIKEEPTRPWHHTTEPSTGRGGIRRPEPANPSPSEEPR
ncbi:hypothetical protein MTR67_039691 [Solanum verrucosum]|uniref:Tf2-1-like SH3-like domain-containing protein n=1 Tax=Solanum verrucosum TaxID=315347 RepID=A0AAF0ZP43_SOLVR|nr:hypothetical protein MTR67_039691 [Solanum verrucosum]